MMSGLPAPCQAMAASSTSSQSVTGPPRPTRQPSPSGVNSANDVRQGRRGGGGVRPVRRADELSVRGRHLGKQAGVHLSSTSSDTSAASRFRTPPGCFLASCVPSWSVWISAGLSPSLEGGLSRLADCARAGTFPGAAVNCRVMNALVPPARAAFDRAGLSPHVRVRSDRRVGRRRSSMTALPDCCMAWASSGSQGLAAGGPARGVDSPWSRAVV